MSSHRLVLVGECPNKDSIVDRPSLALTGDTGKRLCAIAGWEWLDYLRYTERFNLFYTPQFAWNRWRAKESADEMRPLLNNRRVILLGSKVAEAFGYSTTTFTNYVWFTDLFPSLNTAVALVPHPSGRNRMWNSKDEQRRAREFLQDLLS